MSSASERQPVNDGTEAQPGAEPTNIVIERHDGVVSIRYRGTDSETRYQPPKPSVWWLLREAWRMGA